MFSCKEFKHFLAPGEISDGPHTDKILQDERKNSNDKQVAPANGEKGLN